MRLLVLLAIVPLLLSGCIGIGVKYSHSANEPNIALSKNRLQLIRATPTEGYSGLTKAEILQSWGEPDTRRVQNNTETWIYNQDLRWNGLVLIAILPIPLVLPVGHDYISITFEGDRLTSIKTKGQGSAGAWCPSITNVHAVSIGGCKAEVTPEDGLINKEFFDRAQKPQLLGWPQKNTQH